MTPPLAREPSPSRRITIYVGRICEAGQHGACEGAYDNMDEEDWREVPVWVCACSCHPREGGFDAD